MPGTSISRPCSFLMFCNVSETCIVRFAQHHVEIYSYDGLNGQLNKEFYEYFSWKTFINSWNVCF